MRRPIGRAGVALALASLIVLVIGVALAYDPPDSKVNPQSGFIETVDSVQVGSSWEIRHTLTPPQGPQLVTLLSSSTLEDRDPRLTVRSVVGRGSCVQGPRPLTGLSPMLRGVDVQRSV
jgi:hypothetical protein